MGQGLRVDAIQRSGSVFELKGEYLDELADLYARIQALQEELAEANERAKRMEWARDMMLERYEAIRARLAQIESDGNELAH